MGSPVRDTQRQKAYDWERKHLALGRAPNLTLSECEELIAKVCERYGVPKPRLKDGRGCTYARGGEHAITLPLWSRSLVVTLHEVAHTITLRRHPTVAWHGPEWLRVFCDLLETFAGFSRTHLITTIRESKLRVASAAVCAPPKRRDVRRLAEIQARLKEISDQKLALEREMNFLRQERQRLTHPS